jgi:hypothetical protein
MGPHDDGGMVISTEDFREDCRRHGFPDEEVETVRALLLVNPELGDSIKFAAAERTKIKCGHLRVLHRPFCRNGAWVRAAVLYVYVKDMAPLFLLRLEIDDARGARGPFGNPNSWPHWAELIGELVEIIMRHVV